MNELCFIIHGPPGFASVVLAERLLIAYGYPYKVEEAAEFLIDVVHHGVAVYQLKRASELTVLLQENLGV